MFQENPILKEVEYVINNSKDVKINTEKIKEVVKNIKFEKQQSWTQSLPFDLAVKNKDDLIKFYFILNSLNFSYWGNPRWTIDYKGLELNGSYAMIGALNRAIEEGVKIFNPKFLQNMPEDKAKEIFRGEPEIPLLKERIKILRELGKIINKRFDGNFSNVLTEANYDSMEILELLTKEFPFLDDYGVYDHKKIHFQKRAQLLISDISHLSSKEKTNIKNIDYLTAFADYKIPMVLRELGIIEYSSELSEIISKKQEIRKNDSKEIEIRAALVYSIELIKKEVNKVDKNINATDIDHSLWLMSQTEKFKGIPYHKTRTIFY